jgi:hypothetical protein
MGEMREVPRGRALPVGVTPSEPVGIDHTGALKVAQRCVSWRSRCPCRAWAHGFYRTAAVRERSARQWGWVGVWICVAVAVITLSHGRGDLGGSGDPAWAAEATRQALAHEAVAAAPPPPRRREGRDEGRHGSGDPAARFDTTRAAPDAR